MSRTVIVNFIKAAREHKMTDDELSEWREKVMEAYDAATGFTPEQKRTMLQNDILWLFCAYRDERRAVNPSDPHDIHRDFMLQIQMFILDVTLGCNAMGIRLSGGELQRYKGADFGVIGLDKILSEVYAREDKRLHGEEPANEASGEIDSEKFVPLRALLRDKKDEETFDLLIHLL